MTIVDHISRIIGREASRRHKVSSAQNDQLTLECELQGFSKQFEVFKTQKPLGLPKKIGNQKPTPVPWGAHGHATARGTLGVCQRRGEEAAHSHRCLRKKMAIWYDIGI